MSSAVIDAAIADLRVDDSVEPTWSRLGRELLARHAGRQTPDRSAFIAAEAGKHARDAQSIARLPQTTNQEKAALKTLLGKSYPSPSAPATAAAAESAIPQGSSVMRTIPALWPGFAKSLFEAAKCKLDRTAEFGVVSVVYRPDGRIAQLGVEGTLLKSECVLAMTALARLTLEHQTRKPTPGTPEFLVLPVTSDYVDCADREPRDFMEPGRIGRGVPEPPRKVRDVKPTYPPALQQQGVSGTVILEGVISRTGCVSEVSVLKGVAPPMDFSALKAASAWRFEPAVVDGKAVPVVMTITVNFALQ